MNSTAFLLSILALLWAHCMAVKTSDVKDKRGTISGSYSSPSSSYGAPDHSLQGSGFTPITPPVGVYPQNAPISALLIPGNLLYGQGLDYSGLSYGSYGGIPSVPSTYPYGLNLATVGSPSVTAYKLGPVTFNPSQAATPYVSPAYPPYNILSSLSPDYTLGSAYAVPASYPSSSLPYSPSYSSGSSYPSYSSNSLSSYSSPSHSSSTYSSSPPYSAFVGNHHSGSSYSSYSSPSYSSSSGYPSGGYSSQSSYSSPSNSYSHSSSSSYPSSVYGPPSYKSSPLYSKY